MFTKFPTATEVVAQNRRMADMAISLVSHEETKKAAKMISEIQFSAAELIAANVDKAMEQFKAAFTPKEAK